MKPVSTQWRLSSAQYCENWTINTTGKISSISRRGRKRRKRGDLGKKLIRNEKTWPVQINLPWWKHVTSIGFDGAIGEALLAPLLHGCYSSKLQYIFLSKQQRRG